MTDKVTPFLPVALEREVRTVLDDSQIYDITSYGWLNENDPDPKFIGHAMWGSHEQFIDELDALFGERAMERRPGDLDKLILTLGEDFSGMVQASRLSIGLALLWHYQAKRDCFGESPFYWLHHTDSFLKLAIASDRLRDLLVVVCTGNSPDVYKRQAKRNRKFVTPFNEAAALLAARGYQDRRLVEPALLLPTSGAEIFKFIARRNLIVHDVATRMATLVRDNVSKLQERYDRQQIVGFALNPTKDKPPTAADQDTQEREFRAGIERSVQEIASWYKLLIHASNDVFQIEYWVAHLKR